MATGGSITVEVVYNKLPQISAAMRPKAEAIVAKVALDIQAGAQGRAPVRTGTLKNSIQAKRIGPMHWEVWVGVDYGIYVEKGTRHMGAQPFLRPAVDGVRGAFLQAMRKVATP